MEKSNEIPMPRPERSDGLYSLHEMVRWRVVQDETPIYHVADCDVGCLFERICREIAFPSRVCKDDDQWRFDVHEQDGYSDRHELWTSVLTDRQLNKLLTERDRWGRVHSISAEGGCAVQARLRELVEQARAPRALSRTSDTSDESDSRSYTHDDPEATYWTRRYPRQPPTRLFPLGIYPAHRGAVVSGSATSASSSARSVTTDAVYQPLSAWSRPDTLRSDTEPSVLPPPLPPPLPRRPTSQMDTRQHDLTSNHARRVSLPATGSSATAEPGPATARTGPREPPAADGRTTTRRKPKPPLRNTRARSFMMTSR